MASTVFPPVGTASIGTSESHPDLGTTKRTRGDDVSFMRYDMSEANERAARATIQAKQESHRARAANEARYQMANRMVSANKQLAAETQEVAKLRAAVDWTSGAQRTAAENSLQQKIELLDTAERERDTAQIKMRAAESRASLAMQTAKKEERDKLEWQRKFFELNSTKGGAIDDVARLETQVKRDAEKFERLDREYKALMEGQGALQEQIAAERASMSAQFDELNAERDKMMEARKLDASDTKEKERLALVVEDLQSQLADTSASFSKLQFVEQQLAGFQTQRDAAIAERDETLEDCNIMQGKLSEQKRICETLTTKLEITRTQLELTREKLEQTKNGWNAYKKEQRLLLRQNEVEWEQKDLQSQALFMSRVAKMEGDCTARVQRHMDESKHLHEALDHCRGDLRRFEASASDWKVKATGSFAKCEELEIEVARLKTKLKSMEVAAQRKAAEMLELETIAAQVNPLKERVARYRQDIRERDELIERLKADAHLREGKIVDLNSVINDWKCKVGAKQEEIDERDKQIVTLQAALIDKYEDIRSQIFTAEQMARYKAFEVARLQNILVYRGRTEDVYCQTEMPGEEVSTQCNFPKLPRLALLDEADGPVETEFEQPQQLALVANS